MSERSAEHGQQRVLSVLDRLCAGQTWTGSQAALAKQCRCSVRTVARRISELKQLGRIELTGRPGVKCEYRVVATKTKTETVVAAPAKAAVKRRASTLTRAMAVIGSLINAVMGARPVRYRKGKAPDRRQMTLDFEGVYENAISNQGSRSQRAGGGIPAVANDPQCGRGIGRDADRRENGDHGWPVCGDDHAAGRSPSASNQGMEIQTGCDSVEKNSSEGLSVSSRGDLCRSVRPTSISSANPGRNRDSTVGISRLASASLPPDSMRSKFRLPANTTAAQLRNVKFLEPLYRLAVKCGCCTESDWLDFVALAVNCCEVESQTPAALFLWTMRGGSRRLKRGQAVETVDWRAAVRNSDEMKAREMITRHKPPELASGSSNLDLDRDYSVERERQRTELLKKYSN